MRKTKISSPLSFKIFARIPQDLSWGGMALPSRFYKIVSKVLFMCLTHVTLLIATDFFRLLMNNSTRLPLQ